LGKYGIILLENKKGNKTMIKVIALNDDNHAPCFATKDTVYNNVRDFMNECLLKPHEEEYEVHGVYICGPLGELEKMEEGTFIDAFSLLECKPSKLPENEKKERDNYFDLFFDNGDPYWF
jgi:hypothetical protein